MKKLLALILALCLTVSQLAGCGKNEKKEEKDEKAETSANTGDTIESTASVAKYRSFYQIWITSFCDSDGDKTGDLPGVLSKIDYINDGNPDGGDDLGADGIWLSPMMPSNTYHKYNVENYFDIDPAFGTLDDFDKLLKACHERGVNVIIDLVINHAGADHEYFKKACEELRDGKEDGYARYFKFSKTKDNVYQYPVSGSDYYYQADFWDQMPDWNLSYEGTREYFTEIAKFWLDRGVDGFRLDAVKYFQDDVTDGGEFLKWFCDMVHGVKADAYMVGEYWDDVAGSIYDEYDSGIDSMFNFIFANSSGSFMQASHGNVAEMLTKLKKFDANIKKHNQSAINANFLTNHDIARVANFLDESDNKMAAALYMLAPGNSFTYNGEEIGIESDSTTGDENYRTAMIWDNDNLPDIVYPKSPAVKANELGGVAQQLKDSHSLLNTYRKLIKLRQQNPEIVRGSITDTVDFGDNKCGGMIIQCSGARVMVIHNVSDEAKELTVDQFSSAELRGWSTADVASSPVSDEPVLDGTTLKLPARTSVVLKETK